MTALGTDDDRPAESARPNHATRSAAGSSRQIDCSAATDPQVPGPTRGRRSARHGARGGRTRAPARPNRGDPVAR
ncbi:MAG TPA: hypothetical protein VKA84_17030 [Gemmatimonadaceae bacterium]|nr:hypothetical protein [Gemmatimonadaceae bacterium]